MKFSLLPYKIQASMMVQREEKKGTWPLRNMDKMTQLISTYFDKVNDLINFGGIPLYKKYTKR